MLYNVRGTKMSDEKIKTEEKRNIQPLIEKEEAHLYIFFPSEDVKAF